MAYALHIERTAGTPIALGEWLDAVTRTDGLRVLTGDHSVMNSKTGEKITFKNLGGDVEIRLPTGEWWRALTWTSAGAITFRADLLSGEHQAELARIIFAVARRLKAVVTGDDGEAYRESDFGSSAPGQVIKGPWS